MATLLTSSEYWGSKLQACYKLPHTQLTTHVDTLKTSGALAWTLKAFQTRTSPYIVIT